MGIITDIQRFSVEDGPGIRTTVFFKGCNLDCVWCHNPETKSPLPLPRGAAAAEALRGREITAGELCGTLSRDIPFYTRSGGGVTFSGGEPLLQIDFLLECLRLCKGAGVHTAVDTAGDVPYSAFERILPDTDLFLYDIKLLDDASHHHYTGRSNARILGNFRRLHAVCGGENQPGLIVRTLLLPGVNDREEDFTAFARWLKDYPRIARVDVLPYHALGESKYRALGETYRFSGKKPPDETQTALFQTIVDNRSA